MVFGKMPADMSTYMFRLRSPRNPVGEMHLLRIAEWSRDEDKDLRPERATRMMQALLSDPVLVGMDNSKVEKLPEALFWCAAVYTARVVDNTVKRCFVSE